jgi:hypothetical protein
VTCWDSTLGFPGEDPPKGTRRPAQWKSQLYTEAATHLSSRGAGSWGKPVQGLAASVGEPNLLLVHAVSDRTGLYAYVPAVRRWLEWCKVFEPNLANAQDMDAALADYCAYGCFMQKFNISEGRNALWGSTCVYPELMNHTPLAQRALKSWDRLAVGGEGGPIPITLVMLIFQDLREHGEIEASDICILCYDCYLRASDWALIQVRDVSFGSMGVAIQLGIPERGETTKTGTRQGVRPDYELTTRLLRRRTQNRQPQEPLFTISAAQFREAWEKSCARLRWWPGPPHSLRHSGPSHDALHGYRTLDEIKNRGRWRAKTSVLRYMKTHVLVACEAALPDHLRQAGLRLLPLLGTRAAKAIQ